jgi:2-polyprenyl-6-methoxyphenol hydroxylase-like FAD-dependent oxidoreductase
MAIFPTCETDVLIVGAGPTGLVLALWLKRLGVRVRLIDKTAEPGTTSRALGVQARTLEFYAQLGIADSIVEQGRWASAANLWTNGRPAAHIEFGTLGASLSPFPYALIYPQDEHERFLIDCLAELGVTVERCTELVGFQHADLSVRTQILKPDGTKEFCRVGYVAGCDGAHSTVRERLGIGFPGGTYEHLFYVADVEADGKALNGELNIAFDRSDFLVVFPLKGENRARLIGTVRDVQEHFYGGMTWDDVSKHIMESMRIAVEKVNWFSTYRVHHRVAGSFRSGRAFLLGDAAHVHSPVGGQGMNTGIGDAVNLAWKLAAVLGGRAKPALLDSYEQERIAFARKLVETTDRVFTEVTSSRATARLLRLRLAPLFAPLFFSIGTTRRLLFRTVSQTAINYRGSSLSKGIAGAVRGGDRLPWIKMGLNGAGTDNFAPLQSLDWQVHVYGEAKPALQTLCEERQLPLHVFPYSAAMRPAGLRRHAAYLLRPDGYVALAEPDGVADAVASYLDSRGLMPLRSTSAVPVSYKEAHSH